MCLILISIILLFSCSNEEEKIELLQKELNIELPVNYEIIKDKGVTYDAFLGDYSTIITLKFDEMSIDTVVNQIKEVPFYNELNQFRKVDGVRTFIGDVRGKYDLITDSMNQSKYRGSWISTQEGYEFIDILDKEAWVDASINMKENSLNFVYTAH